MSNDIAPPLSISLLPVWPTRADVESPSQLTRKSADQAKDDAQKRRDAAADAQRTKQEWALLAGHLRIELDQAAGRFVQTLTDPTTNEILRQFPHESALAFARAVRAYEMARFRR